MAGHEPSNDHAHKEAITELESRVAAPQVTVVAQPTAACCFAAGRQR
jgi:hypothetical protein